MRNVRLFDRLFSSFRIKFIESTKKLEGDARCENELKQISLKTNLMFTIECARIEIAFVQTMPGIVLRFIRFLWRI